MYLLKIILLFIICCSICFTADLESLNDESPLTSDENEESKILSSVPMEAKDILPKPVQPVDGSRGVQKGKKESIPKTNKNENNNDKAKPSVKVICIENHQKFCEKKFNGYKYNDGCNMCKCLGHGKYLCENKTCKHYALSYGEKPEFCKLIKKKNEEWYNIQKRKSSQSVESQNINKVNNKLQSNTKVLQNEILKVNSKIPTSQSSIDELTNLIKSSNSDSNASNTNVFNKNLESSPNSLSPLEDKTEGKSVTNNNNSPNILNDLPDNDDRMKNNLNKNNNNNKDNFENKKTLIENNIKKVKSTLSKSNSGKSKRKNILSNPPQTKTQVIQSSIKNSLSKMTSKNMVKALIYQVAWNDLTCEKLIKVLKKKYGEIKHPVRVLNHIKSIQKKNTQLKMTILALVRREMNKVKDGRSHSSMDSGNLRTFKKTLNKLIRLNKSLKHIKSKELTISKHRRRRRHYHGTSSNVKTSLIMVFFSVFFVVTLCHY